MSESFETPTARTAIATEPAPPPVTEHRTPKVFKAAAWVAIVAGIVFIVSVIFFTGYALGKHSGHGGYHHRHHAHHAKFMHPRSPEGAPAAVSPGTPAGPGQVPTSVAPSVAPAPTTPGR